MITKLVRYLLIASFNTALQMYVREYRHGDVNTRAMATFAAIHEAVLTSPGAIPNVEYVVSLYIETHPDSFH